MIETPTCHSALCGFERLDLISLCFVNMTVYVSCDMDYPRRGSKIGAVVIVNILL
jgi:hypothetical protein